MERVDFKQKWAQPVPVDRMQEAERFYTDVLKAACRAQERSGGLPIVQTCAVAGLGELYLLRHDPKSLVKAAALFNTALELCKQEGSQEDSENDVAAPEDDLSMLIDPEEEGRQGGGLLADYKRRLSPRREKCAAAFARLLQTWTRDAADIADMPEAHRPQIDASEEGGSSLESSESLASQGYAYLKDDEYPKAAFLLKKALAACGDKDAENRAKYSQDLGAALRKMGDVQQAVIHLKGALQERIQLNHEADEGDVATAQALALFGACLSAGGQFDLAHAYFEAAEETLPMYFDDDSDPDFSEGRKVNDLLRMASLAREGRTAEAGRIFANVDPSSPDLYRSLASQTYDRGMLMETIQFHEAASAFAPDNTSNQHNMACMYHARAQHARDAGNDDVYDEMVRLAEKNFQQAISQNRKDGIPGMGLLAEYGNFLCRTGRWADAVPVLRDVVARPKSAEDASGLIYNQMEMTTLLDEIKAEVKNAKDRSLPVSQRHFAYYLLTRALKETGEGEKAAETVREFQADVDSGDKPFSWSLIGYALRHAGRPEEASAAFMRAFDRERSSEGDLARQNFTACVVSSDLNKPDGPEGQQTYKPSEEEILDLD
ncbi:PREDICTED: uncharacterized protein LOC109487989 isoform X2 [Branchiostoma belcheri]|uniref:Uncharacterized protein LOC109487989 isoform X2 n=1 Tax=Branchiostoma belcheri TaxID=7741 RepID=A0A6P5AZS5_BRABE|nr:PREDICTED: uncharacterized protein LOC109487989 isoform X2 [Branchiostoma belcheri]